MKIHYLRGIVEGRSVEVEVTTRQMMDPSCEDDEVSIIFLDTETRITCGESLSVEERILPLRLVQSDEAAGELSI